MIFRRRTPIVVVSGLPRSGTSMAMRMLEAGGVPILTDRLRAADASNPHGYFEYEPVKRLHDGGDALWLAGARGKAVKIISFLLTWLPEMYDYRVIFIKRDLDEVVRSQAAMLEAGGQTEGVESPERLREIYAKHLADVERFLSSRRCFQTLFVEHRAALADPRREAARINEFLGGKLEVDKMATAVDRQLHRQKTVVK